jgi:asparagine synthase (glutamine-hydrolysing)
MCGIFAYLLKQCKSNPNISSTSWRRLYNELLKTQGRGPDNVRLERVSPDLILGFNRLRINDVSEAGDQPLRRGKITVIANAEIYNYKEIKEKYGFTFQSSSDCEILLHLFEKFGNVESFIDELDGVFAFVIHDGNTGQTHVGRDPIGVRPIFYGLDTAGNYAFASEAKALMSICDNKTIKPFKPGHFWSSATQKLTKWYNPTYNTEETNMATYNEAPVLNQTANLLY